MKKLLLTLVALPVATVAVEASAQQGYSANSNMDNRIAGLETRLNAGVQAGVIDRREERNLRRQLRDLQRLEMTYSRNGLTRQERQTLQQRTRSLRQEIRTAGGTGWANRYGWNDNDFDAYGRTNTNVTYDRYGRPITGTPTYDGRGGPYEPPYGTPTPYGTTPYGTSRGLNIGDVITNLLGGNALSRVPSNYSSQYRDRSDVYFRSDGRQVYEIDARTHRVIRVHPMR